MEDSFAGNLVESNHFHFGAGTELLKMLANHLVLFFHHEAMKDCLFGAFKRNQNEIPLAFDQESEVVLANGENLGELPQGSLLQKGGELGIDLLSENRLRLRD